VAADEPAGMVSDVIAGPPAAVAKVSAPALSDESVTVVAVAEVAAAPAAFCSCTVIGPRFGAAEAEPDRPGVVTATVVAVLTATAGLAALVPVQLRRTAVTRNE
jgi:hypothetical protein